MERRYVPVAEISRPHGVQGELRVRLYNEASDLLLSRPAVRLRLSDGGERDAKILGARPVDKALLVRIAGIDDRDAAEALRGATVCVPRDAFGPLDEGEFYACDIEGARVLTPEGELLGHVKSLQSYPTCDVLVVEREGAASIEIPLVESFVSSVDVEQQVVQLVTLEGLV
ncbi:ribosome maturation factor RimM [Sorangium cellulosum]|uniref:Ribosome maturation factor RimM n=1 Tax=Sorangium cellulosum TaxID=56 RepID=A0A4P2Q2Y8_SORCE|nr:ribosome maturation factor RimM [Sorangium cellulosum]AUX23654.1 ribosome maturation factor RimM [Sorangium cellulosum]